MKKGPGFRMAYVKQFWSSHRSEKNRAPVSRCQISVNWYMTPTFLAGNGQ